MPLRRFAWPRLGARDAETVRYLLAVAIPVLDQRYHPNRADQVLQHWLQVALAANSLGRNRRRPPWLCWSPWRRSHCGHVPGRTLFTLPFSHPSLGPARFPILPSPQFFLLSPYFGYPSLRIRTPLSSLRHFLSGSSPASFAARRSGYPQDESLGDVLGTCLTFLPRFSLLAPPPQRPPPTLVCALFSLSWPRVEPVSIPTNLATGPCFGLRLWPRAPTPPVWPFV